MTFTRDLGKFESLITFLLGKYIFFAGIIITVAGILLWLKPNLFSWFGNLPGDIKIEKENVKVYFPLTSMILLSVALSAIVWLAKKI